MFYLSESPKLNAIERTSKRKKNPPVHEVRQNIPEVVSPNLIIGYKKRFFKRRNSKRIYQKIDIIRDVLGVSEKLISFRNLIT